MVVCKSFKTLPVYLYYQLFPVEILYHNGIIKYISCPSTNCTESCLHMFIIVYGIVLPCSIMVSKHNSGGWGYLAVGRFAMIIEVY